MTSRRLLFVGLVVLIVAAGLAAVFSLHQRHVPAGNSSADEAEFLALVNQERANHGVPPLPPDPRLAAIARGWSAHMAAQGAISHNPNLRSQMPPGWTGGGENVGEGSSVEQIHRAFVASSEHEANIIDPAWTQVGIGVAYSGSGQTFVTEDFAQYPRPVPPTSPAPPAPPHTASPSTLACH